MEHKMSEEPKSVADQTAAFQHIWVDAMSKMLHTTCAFGPSSAPPEVLKEIRGGILQALAKAWEEFMRSPQFLESMKQWMDSAIAFRKMSNEFMASARNELQGTSREDIDTIMLAIRHLEKRLLDRIDQVAAQSSSGPGSRSKGAARSRRPAAGKKPAVPTGNGRKTSPPTRKAPVS